MLTRSDLSTFFRPDEDFVRVSPSSAAPVFSGAAAIAQVLDPTNRRLTELLSSGCARNLSEAFQQLNPSEQNVLRERWGRSLDELISLSNERDATIFHYGLLEVGHRLEEADQLDLASVLYSALVAGNAPRPPLHTRAQARLNAMNGIGDWRARLAFNLERLPTNATRWDMLFAMGGAGLVFRGVRLAATARWASSFESAFALNAATTSAAFLSETAAFTGLGRLFGSMAGNHYDWSAEGTFNEWAGGAAMLLGLKAMGGVFGNLSERWAGGETAFARVTRAVAPQAGMFFGIVLGNRLAELGAFHPERHGDTWLVDGLTTLLEFNIAGRLQRSVSGPGLSNLEGRMEAHTRALHAGEFSAVSRSKDRLLRGNRLLRGFEEIFAGSSLTPEGIRMAMPEAKHPFRETAVFSVSQDGEEGPRPALSNEPSRSVEVLPAEDLRRAFQEVLSRGLVRDLKILKNLTFSFYENVAGANAAESMGPYYRSNDPEQWRLLIRILIPLIQTHPHMLEGFLAHPEIRSFFQDWARRPHFNGYSEVTLEVLAGTNHASKVQNRMEDLRRVLASDPTMHRFQALAEGGSSAARRDKTLRPLMLGVREPSGDMAFVGNYGEAGFIVRFGPDGFLKLPIRVTNAFRQEAMRATALELRGGSLAESAPSPEPSSEPPAQLPSLRPEDGENPAAWAERLFAASREKHDIHQLQVAQSLEAVLMDPTTRAFGMEAVAQFRALSSSKASEGEHLLLRDYELPGLEHPLTILSLPSTFLPENWSLFFAKRVVADIERKGGHVDRALEIGSGTGWLSVYLAKLGMVGQMTGVDRTGSAVSVSRINAIINGVEAVEFLQSDLLKSLPAAQRFDLVVACIPQIPSLEPLSERQFADQYPNRENAMMPYGLALVFDALGEARPQLAEGGRVLFNLAGRPGLETLKEMYHRAGFAPVIHHPELIPQDPSTSLAPLVSLEQTYGVRFEFLAPFSERVMSAQEAMNVPGIRHRQYLIEGLPFEGFFRAGAREAVRAARVEGYTPDPGSEAPELREALHSFLRREWGAQLSDETLFIGPSHESMLANLLRLSVAPGGRVAWVGENSTLRSRLAPRLTRILEDTRRGGVSEWVELLRVDPPQAMVLQLERLGFARDGVQKELSDFLREAAARNIPLFFVEPHPVRDRSGLNPLLRALDVTPQARPYVNILQPLDGRFALPEFPLTAAMISNAALYRNLVRHAEVDYSRVSTPLQRAYAAFLESLPVSGRPPKALVRLDAVAGFSAETPLTAALIHPQAFESSASGAHPDPIDMSFGESEMKSSRDIRAKLAIAPSLDIRGLHVAAHEAVSRYLRESRGVVYSPEQIVLGAGVQPLIGASLAALGSPRFEGAVAVHALVPRPSYGLYFPTVTAAGARLTELPTFALQRFLLDGNTLSQHVSQDAHAVPVLMLNSPTNPAGQYYNEARLGELSSALNRGRGYLLFDDVFGMLSLAPKLRLKPSPWSVAQREMGDRFIGFGGLSKEFAVGGLRFGFAVTPRPDLAGAIRENLVATPDPFALVAASELLPHWRDEVERHRHYLSYRRGVLAEFFREKNIDFHEAQGGYALFVDLRKLMGRRISTGPGRSVKVTRDNLHELLMTQAGIKIHSDRWARVENHYRFVYSIDRIDEALQRLRRFFQTLR